MGIGEVNRLSGSTFEISYSVHIDLWGQGVGTALARALADWTFDSFPEAERVQATCDPRNVGSSRVLANIGMHYEGTLRHTLHISDGWRDSKIFSV
ncbi:GNAT family N-acetyltransferase, partial [Brachybacterium sp. AOP3-A1-3]|uniref:GNAT family N-acetyltransferase n=1 Tax=Brachybacterium sp. AOP3-A1-3 TaxID=3457699 RepID=UPI004033B0BB